MAKKKQWNIHAVPGNMCITLEGSNQLLQIRTETKGPCVFTVSPVRSCCSSLSDLVDNAIEREDAIWAKLEQRFQTRYEAVEQLVDGKERSELQAIVKRGFGEIEDILKAVWLVGDASDAARKFIDLIELSWLLKSFQIRLALEGYSAVWVDSARLFHGSREDHGIHVDYLRSKESLQAFLNEHADADTVCIAGGWFQDENGRLIDSSHTDNELLASACGNLLEAEEITLWNEKRLVTTADPERVPGAGVIEDISYAEATELSYFGAEVLHPQAFVPAMAKEIPIRIRSFSQMNHRGTKISNSPGSEASHMVKGFSAIEDTALINVEGAGMIGVPGISSRLFSAMRESSISVVLISQASSEHSICFAVPEQDADTAAQVARQVFSQELTDYKIQSIEVEKECAILAAVGEQMPGVPGIAAKFFGALGKAHINVMAIAQGSSERNISAVIKNQDATRALRALHAGFFLSKQTLSIGIIGPGLIGSTLLRQISHERERLKQEFHVDLRVRGVANSTRMVLHDQGIDLLNWEGEFKEYGKALNLQTFVDHVAADYFPHTVLIDCSTSDTLPTYYTEWIERGIHIITPNKKAGTAPEAAYQKMMEAGRKMGKHFLYETTVGAGLPIIGTLKDLIQTGDRIKRIEGVFSGTLAYLFWRFDGSEPFSKLVHEAKSLGYTEPDPRDDLSGMDIVRKAVILAREVGMHVEVDQVPVLNLVTDYLMEVPLETCMEELSLIDEHLEQLRSDAENRGELLRYVGVIDPVEGTCKVELKGYPKDHPFARISGTDNIVAFTTDRYHDQPLVIQGPGAGPEVTAGGVFADLLRLGSFLGAKF
ncbi:MAG: bifunctional aspartate kinase/homoserine dehydrogenase I [Spirochaetota bacterium]